MDIQERMVVALERIADRLGVICKHLEKSGDPASTKTSIRDQVKEKLEEARRKVEHQRTDFTKPKLGE